MTEITVPLATVTIAGIESLGTEAMEELNYIEADTILILEPEPTNKYDSNAVKVLSPERIEDHDGTTGGVFLGYIPRSINTIVLDYMTAPKRIEVRLVERGCDLINIVGFEPGGCRDD